MRENVKFEGLLRASGKKSSGEESSSCTGWCTKVTLMEGTLMPADVAFIDYRITDTSVTPRLPDGNYELSAHGETMPAMRRNGRWSMSD